jgi:hypothetical protein
MFVRKRKTIKYLLLCWLIAQPAWIQAAETKADPTVTFSKEIQPILQKYCLDCHGADLAKGDLNLENFSDYEKVLEAPEQWQTVLERVQAFEMPPKKKRELPFDVQQQFVSWLRRLPKPEQVDCSKMASDRTANFYRGYVMSRRLNRAEYARTIHDLLGVDVQVDQLLPADGGGGEGFDTAGNALFTSSIHIEKYLAAAELALAKALPDRDDLLSADGKANRLKLLGGVEAPPQEEARGDARKVVANLARLAFRRPGHDSEVERYMALFDRAQTRGDAYLPSLTLALKGILISPNFLFLVEPEPDQKGIQPLAPFPLASRLSYFLWSTMPDEELFELAASGKLSEPDVLQKQLHRMLASPKANALGERFAMQWLDLEKLGTEVKPDQAKFPEWNAELAEAMKREVSEFFNYVIQTDRPLTDLIDANYSFANARLAPLYGLTNQASGAEFQKVQFTGKERGGIVGMAAVHAATSFPLRTSPVLRGRWVLETLLGEKVKPPPPGTPSLDEHSDKAKNQSLREQLQEHRAKPECASCHDKMDPLGFGMENFDPLGRWRDTDRGLPIDAKGTLPSGDSFVGPSGLKSILMKRKDDVIRLLVKKMTGYAFGRELNKFDDCVVDRAMKVLKEQNYRSSALIEEIVLSFPFRHRFYPNAVEMEPARKESNL